ncbi:MAG TPA: MraY family glycosyltransferase [Ktedonobacteraceae bacterium]|nr:MraY family glycosyltransferase [Ktedonobacteraceae bacterium]
MPETSFIHILLSLLIPTDLFHNNIETLLVGGAVAFALALALTFAVKAFCYKVGWLDRPAARRVHKKAVPRLGGVAMYLAFVIVAILFYAPGRYSNPTEISIFWLLIVASTFIVVVHIFDDVIGLKPRTKLIAQTIAAIIVMGPWIPTFRGVLLYTFSNPFYHLPLPFLHEPSIFLFMQHADFSLLAIPAVLLTWFWTVGMMNTINLIDGLDGLATGVVGITALFITITSFIQGQQSIAILAAIFTGAVFGFLPLNWNPAKIFMGDSGAMFLGLGLAVLSIMGGAKLALALMVLGLPILDLAVVAVNRKRRGQSAVHFDMTHLHYRLLSTGLSVKKICLLFYALTIMFGVLALRLARIYKFIGLGLVGLTMICLVIWIDYRLRQRGVPIKPDSPSSPSDDGENVAIEKKAEMKTGEVQSVITTPIPGTQTHYM